MTVKLSYEKGATAALEKIAMGGFGSMLSNMGSKIKSALTSNPNRVKMNAGSGTRQGIRYKAAGSGSSQGNLSSTSTATTSTGG